MYGGVKAWNNIALDIRQSASYNAFKIKFKKHLLQNVNLV